MAYDFNTFYNYETLQGDTFDSIALDFYKSELSSSLIMKANPEYIGILIFDAGEKLKIPVVETSTPSTLPPWR